MLAKTNHECEAFLAAQQGNIPTKLSTITEGDYADAIRLLTTARSIPLDGKATLFVTEHTLQEDVTPEQVRASWIIELDICRQDCAHVDIISPVAFKEIGPITRATPNK